MLSKLHSLFADKVVSWQLVCWKDVMMTRWLADWSVRWWVVPLTCQIYMYVCVYTGWGQIKYLNTEIAISQKCLNIFAPNFARLPQYCALMYCFVLYALDICQIDGNANFKNIFHNWTKSWFYYQSNWATSTTFVVTSLFLCSHAT